MAFQGVVDDRDLPLPQRRALAVAQEHYAGAATLIRHPDISLFARIVGGGTDVGHAELLSFLLFTPEFARALTALSPPRDPSALYPSPGAGFASLPAVSPSADEAVGWWAEQPAGRTSR